MSQPDTMAWRQFENGLVLANGGADSTEELCILPLTFALIRYIDFPVRRSRSDCRATELHSLELFSSASQCVGRATLELGDRAAAQRQRTQWWRSGDFRSLQTRGGHSDQRRCGGRGCVVNWPVEAWRGQVGNPNRCATS